MARVSPVYAVNRDVYHNNNQCTERNNIETANRRSGTGGKRLCSRCSRLNKQGK